MVPAVRPRDLHRRPELNFVFGLPGRVHRQRSPETILGVAQVSGGVLKPPFVRLVPGFDQLIAKHPELPPPFLEQEEAGGSRIVGVGALMTLGGLRPQPFAFRFPDKGTAHLEVPRIFSGLVPVFAQNA